MSSDSTPVPQSQRPQRTVHTVTLEAQGIEPDVPLGVLCSAVMTMGTRRGGGRKGSYTKDSPGRRASCPNRAVKTINGRPYCAMHGPTQYRIDPFYRSAAWKSLREKTLNRDNHRCRYCGNKAVQADHIIPRAKGGPDALHNLSACCVACNKLAGGAVFASFEAKKTWILANRKRVKALDPP